MEVVNLLGIKLKVSQRMGTAALQIPEASHLSVAILAQIVAIVWVQSFVIMLLLSAVVATR